MSETRRAERTPSADEQPHPTFLSGGGDTGAIMRITDWAATPLGPTRTWPQSLRTSVSICLGARTPIAVYWGPELAVLYNDALVAFADTKHPAALGRPMAEALPELRQLVEPSLHYVLRTGETITSDDVRLSLLLREPHEERYVAFTYSAIRDESGGVGGVFCVVTDTTDKILDDRRQRLAARAAELSRALSEEQTARAAAEAARARIYSLFMQAPAPICIFAGPDHRYVFANQPYLQLVGRDDILGMRFADAYPERTLTLERFDRAYATGEAFRSDDVRFRFARREPGVIEDALLNVVYQPYRDHDGKVAGISVVAFDVTDIDIAQRTNERARAAAEASVEAHRAVLEFQERFVAVLGHDLRNPLAAIDMAAGLLRQQAEQSNDRVAQRVLSRIRSSSLRMSRMVEQILDLSRSRIGGGLVVRPAPMDLCAMLTGVIEELRTANPSHEVELRCGPMPGVWDRDRLEQVFSNLIGNAIHHGLAETPITIAVTEVGAEIHITVHNQGPSIPEALRKTLFNPFRRGDRDSRAAKTAGLGLGLYISRELVVAHGGDIGVDSTSEGTTFRVTLPRTSQTPSSPEEAR